MNWSHGYGLGAFAYYRRMIEELIKQIIVDVSNLDLEGSDKVREAWEQYLDKPAMSTLLDSVTPHLPSGLLEIGDNPLKLLYGTASLGIHELSEEDCLKHTHSIDILLRFVIRKMSEEKHIIKKARAAAKKLKELRK